MLRLALLFIISIHHIYSLKLSSNVLDLALKSNVNLKIYPTDYAHRLLSPILLVIITGLQILYIACSIIQEYILLSCVNETKLKKNREFIRYFYHLLVAPGSMYVSFMFWSLYCYDRELVSPKELDQFSIKYSDHSLHTANLFLLLLEYLYAFDKPPSFSKNCKFVLLPVLSYWVLLYYTRFVDGVWLYIMYIHFNIWEHLIFAVCPFLLTVAFYYLHTKIHEKIYILSKQKVKK